MKITFLKLNVPTVGGRIYSKEVMDVAIKKAHDSICNGKFFVRLLNPENLYSTNILDVIAVVNTVDIDGDQAVADITFLDRPSGKLLEMYSDSRLDYTPRGSGNLIPNGDGTYNVENYTLEGIHVTLK